MIFPELKNKRFGLVSLNTEAERWIKGKNFPKIDHPLLVPDICQDMVSYVHEKFSVDFSYGGWMEDRSFLWHGSYLDEDGGYIHLGIDINVSSGTKIAVDFDAEVMKIDDDYPEQGGWGPRVILKHLKKNVYVIYAHLDREITCKVGDVIQIDTVFAKVGKAPFNGNWFPHVHVQIISSEYFVELTKNNSWDELDGYGLPSELEKNSKKFPDPLQYISLI